jgi:hypothetical protein
MEKTKLQNKKVVKETLIEEKLIGNKLYLFEFSDNIPYEQLKNKKEYITGELATIFLKQNYGILC